jgi:hypothetical protein
VIIAWCSILTLCFYTTVSLFDLCFLCCDFKKSAMVDCFLFY